MRVIDRVDVVGRSRRCGAPSRPASATAPSTRTRPTGPLVGDQLASRARARPRLLGDVLGGLLDRRRRRPWRGTRRSWDRRSRCPCLALLVEAALGLVAELLLLDHARGCKSGTVKTSRSSSLGQRRVAVVDDVGEGVEADQVRGAEAWRSWGGPSGSPVIASTSSGARPCLEHQVDGRHHRVRADAVADEVRRVLGRPRCPCRAPPRPNRLARSIAAGSVSGPATSSSSFM